MNDLFRVLHSRVINDSFVVTLTGSILTLATSGNIFCLLPLFTFACFDGACFLDLVGLQAKQACLPWKHIEVGVGRQGGPLAPFVLLSSTQVDSVSQMWMVGLLGIW